MPPERFADRTAFNIPCLGDRLTYSFELLPVALLRSEIKFITMGEHQKKQVLFCFRLNKRLHPLHGSGRNVPACQRHCQRIFRKAERRFTDSQPCILHSCFLQCLSTLFCTGCSFPESPPKSRQSSKIPHANSAKKSAKRKKRHGESPCRKSKALYTDAYFPAGHCIRSCGACRAEPISSQPPF